MLKPCPKSKIPVHRIIVSTTVQKTLVEEPLARRRAAQAGNPVEAADFALEFVVVRQLLICGVVIS